MKEATEDKTFIDYTLSPDDEGFVDYELPEEVESELAKDIEFRPLVVMLANAQDFIVSKVRPKLEMLGFEWLRREFFLEGTPDVSDWFRKYLEEEVYSFVNYSVTIGAGSPAEEEDLYSFFGDKLRFGVWLYRDRAEFPRIEHRHPKHLTVNLKKLLRQHYRLGLYPYRETAWFFGNEGELAAYLEESLGMFQKYGLPFLEDLTTKNPSPT